jgi:SAM-dependent methyltransferase
VASLVARAGYRLKLELVRRLGFGRFYYPTPPAKLAMRRAMARFLQGDGIEIGALHQPLPLGGLPIARIRYVDRLPLAGLRGQYPEFAPYRLAPVDILDDGEQLATLAGESLDFIIANHFIEHCRSPLGALRRWLGCLRPGGVIYLAVPDMRRTFDAGRPLTSLEHLLADERAPAEVRAAHDRAHYLEYATCVDRLSGDAARAHAEWLLARGYSIHFHTFLPDSFLELLHRARESLGLPFEIHAFAATWPGSDEFLVVLARR